MKCAAMRSIAAPIVSLAMRGRKFRRNHPHQRHEWLAPVAVALDYFQLAPAYRRAHRFHLAQPAPRQFGDEARLGLEKMDVGIPQRVVGIEDQVKRTPVSDRFVRI